MRLHTALPMSGVYRALEEAKRKGLITNDVHFVIMKAHKSSTHAHAYEIQLGTWDKESLPKNTKDQYGKTMHVRRYKNSGSYGATSDWTGEAIWAATWHEWGWFIREIFDADETARWGSAKHPNYASRADFDAKTRGVFKK